MRRLPRDGRDRSPDRVRVTLRLDGGLVEALRYYAASSRISRIAERAILIGLSEIPPPAQQKPCLCETSPPGFVAKEGGYCGNCGGVLPVICGCTGPHNCGIRFDLQSVRIK